MKELTKEQLLQELKEAFLLRYALVESKSKAEEQFNKEDFEVYQKLIDRSIEAYNDVWTNYIKKEKK